MATQTGSIDLNAMDAAEEAAETASKYIEEVTDDGVFVHQTDTGRDGNQPTDADAYGVHISDSVDIIRGGEVVARYGALARIGDADGARTEISGLGVCIYDEKDVPAIKVESTGTQGTVKKTVSTGGIYLAAQKTKNLGTIVSNCNSNTTFHVVAGGILTPKRTSCKQGTAKSFHLTTQYIDITVTVGSTSSNDITLQVKNNGNVGVNLSSGLAIEYQTTGDIASVNINGSLLNYYAKLGSVMKLHGSSDVTFTNTSYKTINLSSTADMNVGNVFEAASNGIKCLYDGVIHLVAKVRFADSFTANDYLVGQIYNSTQGSGIQTGRIRTPFAAFNGDVVIDTYASVSAGDIILLRAENVTGSRGSVKAAESFLTACYVSA